MYNFTTLAQASGGIFGSAILALGLTVAVILFVAYYIYFAMAWMTIAKKKKYEYPWLAWIPFANLAMILQLGGFHWAWTFLLLIPIIGWIAVAILAIIATWKIFASLNYPGWFSLSMIIPRVGMILYLIVIGFVAWKNKK